VTWQEELSQLDGALASGQISADDYRRERERILAVATGGGQQGPPTPGGGMTQGQGQTQGQGAGQGAGPVNRGQDAFPPPFKWTTERPGQGAEDRTQAVSPAEKTQVVSNNNAADSTQIVDMNDSPSKGPAPSFGDRTQFVPKIPPNSPPQGMPAQNWPPPPDQQGSPQGGWGPQAAPPWEGQPEELVPPWAGYQAQNSEMFDSDEPSRGHGKVWAIVGVVVVLLAIAGGVLWLTVFNKKDDTAQGDQKQQQQQQQSTNKPEPTSEKPKPFGPLYVPEGTTQGGKQYTAAALEKSKALPTPDVVLLKQAGLNQARAVVVVDDSTTIDLWAFDTDDPPSLVNDFTSDQGRFGFKKVPAESQNGVDVYTSQQKSASRTVFVYRAHYTAGDNVIRVETFDPQKAKAKDKFEAALKAQLQLTPPD
jgi:hypothetical protein